MCDRAVVLVGVQNSAVRIWVAELQQSELVQLIMVVRILGTDLHADHSCSRVVSGSLAATGEQWSGFLFSRLLADRSAGRFAIVPGRVSRWAAAARTTRTCPVPR